MISQSRWIAAIVALALPLGAAARPPAISDTTALPQGPSGEICRAEAAWGDPAAGILDKVRTVRCLGWTETADVGRVYAVGGGEAVRAAVEAAQHKRLQCGATPANATIAGNAGTLFRCQRAGYDAFAFTATAHGRVYAAEGLARFAPHVLAALGSIHPGITQTTLPAFGAASAPAAMAVVEATVDAEAARARRAVVLDHNVLGRHGEAREIALRNTATRATAVSDQIDAELEAALTSANLNLQRAATEQFATADALLQSATTLRGEVRERLVAKRNVYRAIAAIDRKAFEEAYADALLAEGIGKSIGYAVRGDGLAIDARLAQSLNAGGGRRAAGDIQLQAQTLYVIAVFDRTKGDFAGATDAVAKAEKVLVEGLPGTSADTPLIQWLRSALAMERARIAEAPKNPARNADAARAAYAEAVSRLESADPQVSTIYAGTPLLAQRLIDQAGFLVRDGKPGEARIRYARAVRILAAGGAGSGAGVGGLQGYLKLLAEAGNGAPSEADRDEFFFTAQLYNPLAVAAQIAQLKQVAESGSTDAAVRAKAINDLQRERLIKLGQLTTSAAAGNSDGGSRLNQELQAIDANIALLRSQQSADRQYQQLTDTPLTRAELQAILLPDEAYYKLVSLPGASYAMLIERGDAKLFAVGPTAKLRELATTVRKSAAPQDMSIPVFKIAESYDLYHRLFGPVEPRIARLKSLITEPAGAMAQLPYAVLVSDAGGQERWWAGVRPVLQLPPGSPRRSAAAFNLSMVGFLGTQPQLGLSTSVSPRALLTVRRLPAASGGYIGFGGALKPDAAVLATLPQRGAFKGQCSATDARQVVSLLGAAAPIATDELKVAAAQLGPGAEVVEGAAFTDSAITARPSLRSFAILHFATHGIVQGQLGCDQPPALLTSVAGDATSDGLLTLDEIASLSLDANLVVLSACDTSASVELERGASGGGFGVAGGDNALNGLVRSFFYAGARSVLTTYWSIPDTVGSGAGADATSPAAAMMKAMFRAGTAGQLPIAAAVARAQATLHADPATSHPAYWGAFVLVGDGTKPLIAPRLQSAQR